MEFHPETRTILKRATQLALLLGSAEVGVEHLLKCDVDHESTPRKVWDIPFSVEVLRILKNAAELAEMLDSALVCPEHLGKMLSAATGRRAGWASQPREAVDFSECLGPGLERLDPDCRRALTLAWLSREHDELSCRDLLCGLLGISDLKDPASLYFRLLRMEPTLKFLQQPIPLNLLHDLAPPVLTPEVYRVLAIAFQQPGPVTPLELLIALAETGHELLEGLTPDQLR